MAKPAWLKTRPPAGEKFQALNEVLHEYNLNTVCTGSRCPNTGDCWSRGAAAFMIMGSICTRNCRFCAVEKGKPLPLDSSEPQRLAEAVANLALRYVALTSVDRDDLPDGGAGHFAECVAAIKTISNDITVEALIPDFGGNEECLGKIINASPDIIGHNVEVVREFQALARDRRANYGLSLNVLRELKEMSPFTYTKSSLMLGLGETEEMVLDTLNDLRKAGVELLTLGQYLRPSMKHLEVKEYVFPQRFAYFKQKAKDMGFLSVVSTPFARSSYMVEYGRGGIRTPDLQLSPEL